MNIGKTLKGQVLFKSFPPDEVERLTSHTSAKTLEKGHAVYTTDRKATHVFVLLDGQVQLRLEGGRQTGDVLVSRVAKGDLFGIAPLLGCDRYTTRAECTSTSKVLYIEARPLLEMLKRNPVIGHQLMTAVALAYFARYQGLMERVRKVVADLAWED